MRYVFCLGREPTRPDEEVYKERYRRLISLEKDTRSFWSCLTEANLHRYGLLDINRTMDLPTDGTDPVVPTQDEMPPVERESGDKQAVHSAGGSSTHPSPKNAEEIGPKKHVLKKRTGKVRFSGVDTEGVKPRQKKKAVARKAPKVARGRSDEERPAETRPGDSGIAEGFPSTCEPHERRGTSPLSGLENLQMPDIILSPQSLDPTRFFANQSEGMPFSDRHDNIDGMTLH